MSRFRWRTTTVTVEALDGVVRSLASDGWEIVGVKRVRSRSSRTTVPSSCIVLARRARDTEPPPVDDRPSSTEVFER